MIPRNMAHWMWKHGVDKNVLGGNNKNGNYTLHGRRTKVDMVNCKLQGFVTIQKMEEL